MNNDNHENALGTNGHVQYESDWNNGWNAQRGADRDRSAKELLGEALAVAWIVILLWVLFGAPHGLRWLQALWTSIFTS